MKAYQYGEIILSFISGKYCSLNLMNGRQRRQWTWRTTRTAVAVIALPADHTAETKEEPEIETSPKPLVINIPKEQFGKIIIYLDEEVLYEYEGPIKVERSAGEYKVEVHTGTCSCFDDNDNNTTEW